MVLAPDSPERMAVMARRTGHADPAPTDGWIDSRRVRGSTIGPSARARPACDQLRALTATLEDRLRTPMTVLVGHSELLRERADTLPIGQRHSLHALDDAVERLSDAVSRVCRLLQEARVRDPR